MFTLPVHCIYNTVEVVYSRTRVMSGFFNAIFNSVKIKQLGLLILMALCLGGNTFAQRKIGIDEIKSLFIVKFFKYLEWHDDASTPFEIGIVGTSPSLTKVITSASKSPLVKNRRFNVREFNSIEDIDGKDIHLLYIGDAHINRLPEISRRVRRTKTVLVTYNSPYSRDIMLNLKLNDYGNMVFEVNRSNLVYEGVTVDKEILLIGGSELDVAELFRELENSLFVVKNELDEKTRKVSEIESELRLKQINFQKIIKEHSKEIETKKSSIQLAQSNLENISDVLVKTKQKLFQNKQTLDHRISLLKIKELTIDDLSKEISKNTEVLDRQRLEIGKKSAVIVKQQKVLSIIVAISFIFLCLMTVIVKLNHKKKLAIKQLETEKEKTMRLNNELQTFSYTVSHDLRSPLRAIDGFSDVLLEEYDDKLDDAGREYLHYLKQSSKEMAELIDGLLVLSRCSRGELSRKNFDISKCANSVVKDIKGVGTESRLEISVEDHLIANGDPVLIKNVMTNLIGNAWKYSSKNEHPKIAVGQSIIEGSASFYVRDNGVGFDMTHKERLFQPFQRLHKQSEFEGNGIGLATVKKIVEQHGGRVWAEGKVNEGATFYFTLG